mmetsp:Transcript_3418/g.2874  ORF Transcript_3418/g.2874 Transcript_3418/m.2874 type:complete len:87 (+) Transcript_3418:689-949(+)
MAIIRKREINSNKKYTLELPEKYIKMEKELAKVLTIEDSSKERYKDRLILQNKYNKNWRGKDIVDRLYSSTYNHKEKEKRFKSFDE